MLGAANDIAKFFEEESQETPDINQRTIRASLVYLKPKYLKSSNFRKGFPNFVVKSGFGPYEGYETWASYSRKKNSISVYKDTWKGFFETLRKIEKDTFLNFLDDSENLNGVSEEEVSEMKDKLTIIYKDFAAMLISITLAHEFSHIEQYDEYKTDRVAAMAGVGHHGDTYSERVATDAEGIQIKRLKNIFPDRIKSAKDIMFPYLVKITGDEARAKSALTQFAVRMEGELDKQGRTSESSSRRYAGAAADGVRTTDMKEGKTKMNKIFENYFKQNIKEESQDDKDLGRMTFDSPTEDDLANDPLAGYIMQRLNPFLQEMLDDIEELSGRLKNVETGNTRVASLEENLVKEQDVDLDVNAETDLGQMVADMVNQGLNTLEDNNPAKNRETGLDMIAQIRQKLQDPAVVGQTIEDEVQKMLAELT
jgi:hypothetical protein